MQNLKHYCEKFFFLIGERLGIIIVFLVAISLLLTNTAIKAYSESEEKPYRQESIFDNARMPDINPSPEIQNSTIFENKPPISMSFEVDKITPTPTPVIDPSEDAVWLRLAECESHQNWKDDTGNGYYGGLQFSSGAWASVGGHGSPSDASGAEQIMRGKILQSIRGWGAWGGCAKKLGLL